MTMALAFKGIPVWQEAIGVVDMTENEDKRAVIKSKLRQNFDGKIVRKDLTKKDVYKRQAVCLLDQRKSPSKF